jgi:hypothetical protein
VLVNSFPAQPSQSALSAVQLSADPWDPAQGNLILSSGSWQASFAGQSSIGMDLPGGLYFIHLRSDDHGTVTVLEKAFTLVRSFGGSLALGASPNPVLASSPSALIFWSPAVAAELQAYSLSGELIKDFGRQSLGSLRWDLRGAGGQPVAGGIYIIRARVPGKRAFFSFKLAVIR